MTNSAVVGNAEVVVLYYYYDFLVFFYEVYTELHNGEDKSQNIWPCRGRSSHDRPHRSLYRISVFFPRPLWSCARPCSALAIHRRWYHDGFVDAEAAGGSSSASTDISSTSLPVQILLDPFHWGCLPIILACSKSAGGCTRFFWLRLACSSVVV